MHFFYNIMISIWAFSCWSLAGIGPGLLLFPSWYRRMIFLLAPLIGMCFLTLIGLFQITILLIPFTPRLVLGILSFTSLVICMGTHRKAFQIAWHQFSRTLMGLWFIPVVFLLIFAWIFHHGGFQLLVGSSDQLQYCESARQILDEMHTNSPLDVPIARQSHFVHDFVTHFQPYLKSYRRGAELLLAATTAITGLSYQAAFPVTTLTALLTLILSLGFLGQSLRLSRFYCMVLQFSFFVSFYLLLIHIQGSLAMIMGMSSSLITLVFLSQALKRHSWRWILLTAMVMATYISIYSEPAVVNIFLPTLLWIILQIFQSRYRLLIGIRSIAMIYALVFVFAPFAIYSVVFNLIQNTNYVISSFLAASTSLGIQNTVLTSTWQIWNLSVVVLGLVSYYDLSHFNAVMSGFLASHPSFEIVAFFLLTGFSVLGFFRSNLILSRFMSVPLVFWMITSLITAYSQNYLIYARSLHYSMPFAMVGIVLLVSQSNRRSLFIKKSLIIPLSPWIGRIIFSFFICANIYTTMRSINFITSHDVSNDPILIRFDERELAWQQVKNELHISSLHNTPVLISGFKDTIRPLIFSIILRSQPHVLGDSILKFWPVYKSGNLMRKNPQWPFSFSDYTMFNTRVSLQKLKAIEQQENQPWSILQPQLIASSEQAIVPVGHGYPEEWLEKKDVTTLRIKHFPNICDVIYR